MDKIFKFPLLIIMFAALFACDDSDNKNDSDGSSKKSGDRSPSVVYLWVSADSTNGNIGGLDGANTICQTNASNASLPEDVSQHLAVLATSSSHPKDMFDSDSLVKRPDQTSIIDSWNGFFDPNVTLEAAVSTTSGTVWTGLASTGGLASTCSDWTSTLQNEEAGVGNPTLSSDERLHVGDGSCNTESRRFYCVSF